MAQPVAYTRQQNFANWMAAHPGQDPVGSDFDAEFNALKATTDQIRANLALVQRDDTALANGIVAPDSLSTATLALMGSPTPRGTWLTATAYAAKDVVVNSGTTYFCATAHTSGTFATDLAAGKWLALSANAAGTAFTPGGSLVSTTVQAALLELDTDSTTGLATKQASNANLTAEAGLVGAADKVSYYTGAGAKALAAFTAAARTFAAAVDAPGQRAALGLGSAALLTAGTAANNAVQLDGAGKLPPVDGSALTGIGGGLAAGFVMPYGGPGALPSGWLLCDGSAVSRATYAALFAAVGTAYGAGDGATTFNLPDGRSRTVVGAGQGTEVGTFASRVGNTITLSANIPAAMNFTGCPATYHSATTVMTGLTNDTVYYLILVSPNSFKLASSRVNAAAGTAITLSSDGVGAQTFTLNYANRALGDRGGEESHQNITSEIGAHLHGGAGASIVATTGVGPLAAGTDYSITGSGSNTGLAGGDAVHNNMPPFIAFKWLIKT